MPEKPIRRWTLRELLNGSERYSRELSERIRKEIMPAMQDVQRLLRSPGNDTALRNAAQHLLYQTSTFEKELNQLDQIFRSIGQLAKRELDERY